MAWLSQALLSAGISAFFRLVCLLPISSFRVAYRLQTYSPCLLLPASLFDVFLFLTLSTDVLGNKVFQLSRLAYFVDCLSCRLPPSSTFCCPTRNHHWIVACWKTWHCCHLQRRCKFPQNELSCLLRSPLSPGLYLHRRDCVVSASASPTSKNRLDTARKRSRQRSVAFTNASSFQGARHRKLYICSLIWRPMAIILASFLLKGGAVSLDSSHESNQSIHK